MRSLYVRALQETLREGRGELLKFALAFLPGAAVGFLAYCKMAGPDEANTEWIALLCFTGFGGIASGIVGLAVSWLRHLVSMATRAEQAFEGIKDSCVKQMQH